MSKQYGSLGSMGHAKHRKSGTPKNHANSIQKVREYNKAMEAEKELKAKLKSEMKPSVKDLFNPS